jgi:hypothetical protein
MQGLPMTNTLRQYTRATSHGSIAAEESGQGDLPVMEAIMHESNDGKSGDNVFRSTVRLRVAKMAHLAERVGLAMARFLSWYY